MQIDPLPASFSNLPTDIFNLPKYEEIELKKPHLDYWKIILFKTLIFSLLLVIGAACLIFFNTDLQPFWIYISAALAVFFPLLFWLKKAGFNKRGYAMRTHDVIYKQGLIQQETTIIPLNRIQHIELNEGLLERYFKLAALQIFTAGGQTGHLNIEGIPVEEAKSIRDLILHKMEKLPKPTAS
ncbi:membrane protein YdbS with pleckstrin-like domain [Pedobacter sp. UYP30]|uniref:PH domain-containing protein n=1 Tax=Pedobacter sp. UYP30 TaxID=1756400 RepID=UPI0033938530